MQASRAAARPQAPSGATQPSPIRNTEPEKPKSKRPIVIIAVVVAIILIAVLAIVAVNVKSASDAQAKRDAIVAIVQPWQDKVEAVPTNASDRTELLTHYNELEKIKSDLDIAKSANELSLSDGTDCDISEVTELIDEKQSAIRDWFSNDYESSIKSSALPDSANAENTTREATQTSVDALTALKNAIEAEKAIWGSDSANLTRYSDLISRIDAQLARANNNIAQIQAAEEAAAAQAAEEAAAEAVAAGVFSGNTFECSYFTWTYTGSDLANIADEGSASSISNCVYSREFSHDFTAAIHGMLVYVMAPGTKPDKYTGDSTSPSQGWKYIGTTSGGNPVYADYVGSGAFSEFAGNFTLK